MKSDRRIVGTVSRDMILHVIIDAHETLWRFENQASILLLQRPFSGYDSAHLLRTEISSALTSRHWNVHLDATLARSLYCGVTLGGILKDRNTWTCRFRTAKQQTHDANYHLSVRLKRNCSSL